MTALFADLVTKFEALDFAHAPYADPVGVGAALRRTGRRHDPTRVVVLRALGVRVEDDVLREPMGALVRVLLPGPVF